MHHILIHKKDYWREENLTNCFIECIRNLWISLQKQIINDIFFPELNMLERIEEETVLPQICAWIDGLISKHNRTNSLAAFFPEL